jgi:hypothetical protein
MASPEFLVLMKCLHERRVEDARRARAYLKRALTGSEINALLSASDETSCLRVLGEDAVRRHREDATTTALENRIIRDKAVHDAIMEQYRKDCEAAHRMSGGKLSTWWARMESCALRDAAEKACREFQTVGLPAPSCILSAERFTDDQLSM